MATAITKGYTFGATELVTNTKLHTLIESATLSTIADSDMAQITTAGKVSGAALTSLTSIPSGAGAIPAANVTRFAIASQAAGDVLYFDGTNWVRLAKDAGKFLKSGASAVSWDTAGSGDMAYTDTRFKIGQITRAMDAATGDVSYTSVGFSPKCILFFAQGPAANEASFGFDNLTAHGNIFNYGATTANSWSSDNATCIFLLEATGKSQSAVVKTLDADGFTLTWTRTGATAAGTAYIEYLAIR